MRVGIDIKVLSKARAGIGVYLQHCLENLAQFDTENEYILFETGPTGFAVPNSRWSIVRLRALRLPGTLRIQLQMPLYLRKYRVDCFWAPEYIPPLFMTGRIALISTIHDLTYRHFPQTMAPGNLLLMRLLMPLVVRRAALIITDTNLGARELRDAFPEVISDKCRTVYLGHPAWSIPESYRVESRGDHLFFAGSIEPRKNLLGLVRALEIIKERHGHDIHLRIAGAAGWRNREFYRYLEKSPVLGNLEFLGFISDEQLREEYLNCRACVYPSLYEGFGLPLLEALQSDCVVITSKNTTMEEIAPEAAVFADPHDPEDLARALLEVNSPTFDRRYYLNHAPAILSKFTWENAAAGLAAAFEEAVSE